LTVDEVAQHLKVSRRWVYDSIRRGELAAVPVGRYLRVRPEAVRALTTGRRPDVTAVELTK
jgi:excisionase family DNA binding protein